MDLVDLIEAHRFLGNEFLVWLWYKCDLFEGRFAVGKHGVCEVFFDDRITLEAVVVEAEQSLLKGASPAFTPEAHEALRQGKLPTMAKLRIVQEGQEYQFSIKGSSLHLAGIKLPALLSKEDDEKFYERMYLLEKLESILEDLFGEYMALRLSPGAWETVHGAIQAWIYEEPHLSCDRYLALLEHTKPLTRARRFAPTARGGAAREGKASDEPKADKTAKALKPSKEPKADKVRRAEPPKDAPLSDDMPPPPF